MSFWNEMKKRMILGIVLLTALLVPSCVQPLTPSQKEWAELGIVVAFPGVTGTKGIVGELPADELEKQIHSLKIWVFLSEEPHTHVASLTLEEDDFPIGTSQRRYSLPVTRQFASTRPDVDIFVLANQEALGFDFQTADPDSEDPYSGASWNDLNEATFGDPGSTLYHGFGLNNNHPVQTVDPSLGLPMSGYGQAVAIEGEEPSLSVPTIQLERMVSRIRFVFCKTRTEVTEDNPDTEAAITSISLGENLIPKKEYLFSSGGYRIALDDPDGNNYVEDAYSFSWPNGQTLAENDAPENLIYVNQDPQTYEILLNAAVEAGQLTDLGYTYFRESDKLLYGHINYSTKVNGATVPKNREFKMREAGDFARNQTWTVFGYFLSGRNLQLSLSVRPWDYNKNTVDFDDESVICNSKFTVIGGAANGDGMGVPMEEKDHVLVRVGRQQAVRCTLSVLAPRGGTLYIQPLSQHPEYFTISPVGGIATINPDTDGGKVSISVGLSDLGMTDNDAVGTELTFSFYVELGGRRIDGASEIVDKHYHFII